MGSHSTIQSGEGIASNGFSSVQERCNTSRRLGSDPLPRVLLLSLVASFVRRLSIVHVISDANHHGVGFTGHQQFAGTGCSILKGLYAAACLVTT